MDENLIRVIIISPTLAVRVGLRALLETGQFDQAQAIDIVAETADFDNLSGFSPQADVLVAALGADSYVEWEDVLADSPTEISILLLTDDQRSAQNLNGLAIKSWGILSLESSEEELITAIRALYLGLNIAPPEYLEPLISTFGIDSVDELIDELTPRETEVLELLAQGLANKQIARDLEISEHTVKFHISAIYRKLGVTNRTEAVRVGMRLGLVLL